MESVANISIGIDMFMIPLPEKIFLPILLNTKLRTLLCTFIIYLLMLTSSPVLLIYQSGPKSKCPDGCLKYNGLPFIFGICIYLCFR
jgi:hypothetical protein